MATGRLADGYVPRLRDFGRQPSLAAAAPPAAVAAPDDEMMMMQSWHTQTMISYREPITLTFSEGLRNERWSQWSRQQCFVYRRLRVVPQLGSRDEGGTLVRLIDQLSTTVLLVSMLLPSSASSFLSFFARKQVWKPAVLGKINAVLAHWRLTNFHTLRS
jgi:hypothetical protein